MRIRVASPIAHRTLFAGVVCALAVIPLVAQTARKPAADAPTAKGSSRQAEKPPIAQAWIDVATISGMGMPSVSEMMKQSGGMGMAMGSLLGRKGDKGNEFLRTQGMMAGKWMDVTLSSRRNPTLATATQSVPAGSGLAPTLKLQTVPKAPPAPEGDPDFDFERPKGKIYLYWGCSATVRQGQPRVVDLATATPQELGQFFQARRATQRGAHLASGRPSWPSKDDKRLVPSSASIAGAHTFTGEGVPESFTFTVPAAQDFMPAITLQQKKQGGSFALSWNAIGNARGYFLSAMGARGGGKGRDEVEMVIWTSSAVPETGFGLIDYQTNGAVDRWLKEKVLLPPAVTTCAVPDGIFGSEGGGMLRMIAYGNELYLSNPPRPANPSATWAPDWAVKIRVKSVTNAMLGLDMESMRGTGDEGRGKSQGKDEQKPRKKGLKGMFGIGGR